MSAESLFGKQIMLRHGARSDLRLFRNAVGSFWAGQLVSRSPSGLVTLRGAQMVHGGLPEGSADYIGIRRGGQLISLEIKAPKGRVAPEQRAWAAMVEGMGGAAAICRTMAEVDAMLGEP